MIFAYLILLAASLLFYIQFEGEFSFYLFCFVAAYPVVFGTISFILKAKLKVSFETSDISAPKGSKIPIKIIIDNRTPFPVPNCDITVRYCSEITSQAETFKIHTPVFPNNSQELTFGLSYSHYGTVSLKITKVKIFDMLRVIKLRVSTRHSLTNATVTVFPDLIPIENSISDYSELGLEADGYSKVKKGDDPSEVFDIREYNEGDKISRIHWKLTAKQDEMMVKDYSLPIMNGILIALDSVLPNGTPSDPDCYDSMIDAASALSFHLAENDVTHSVMWGSNEADGYTCDKVSDIDDYLLTSIKMVKSIVTASSPAIPRILNSQGDGARRFAHIILCTTSFGEAEKTSLTDSGLAYRYTVLDASEKASGDYTDGELSYIPISAGGIPERIEDIII